MALYGSLLEALDDYYGFDTMQKVYYNGVKLGLQGNKQWSEYYELLAQNTEGLIEYTTASGKPVGLWSVQATSTTTELATTSTSTELVTIDMAMGTEVGEYAGEIIPKLSTVGAEGSTTVGSFVVGEVLPAVAAAATGVVLGVAVDTLLYESNPNYWDEVLPTINPQTWDDIVLGHDTKIPLLHNLENGKSYMTEDTLAYISLWAKSTGIYDSDGIYYETITDITPETSKYNSITFGSTANGVCDTYIPDLGRYTDVNLSTNNGIFWVDNVGQLFIVSDKQIKPIIEYFIPEMYIKNSVYGTYTGSFTYDNKTIYRYTTGVSAKPKDAFKTIYNGNLSQYSQDLNAWVSFYGNKTEKGGTNIDGLTRKGKLPTVADFQNVNTLNDAKLKLRELYPNLYDNAIDVPYYDKNTDSVTHSAWIPAPIPTNYIDNDGSPTNKPNNKPTTNNLNQTNDGSYPDSNTENQAKENTITDSVTPTPPSNIDPVNPILPSEQTPNINLPVSPVDTGLGAVYVPTISQLRSFSEWLWSPNFIDQIKKLFSDPMQGIIGLHQVYFTPSHDGTDTIHCGYLDSEVSSDYTTTRYIKVDCGSVNVKETFANVFDYDPLTTIECYLPFIGIVPLKVGDVMRSTLTIEYVCDVLTGACLCNIYVNRDGAKCVLYSYGGNCAVNYPLSSGSYMGIVSSLVGVGLSIGSAIATGGASIPLSVAGGAVSMMNAHTNVKTSGGYGGNTGAMGIKKPYLIIKNTLSAMPDNYNKYIGNPYNNTKKINECKGFTQANVLHLNGDMLQQEKEEIINLFNSGVII